MAVTGREGGKRRIIAFRPPGSGTLCPSPHPWGGRNPVAAPDTQDVGFAASDPSRRVFRRTPHCFVVAPRANGRHYSETLLTTSSILPPADINEILKHIPHRYPFLLIDRMEACEPGKWVRVIKNVSANDWFFTGVPAERRVMPQMLVLEALAQAAGALCHYSGMMSRIGKSIIFFAGIENCRFGRDVLPGDQVTLECTLKRSMRGVAKLTGTAVVDGELVLASNLTAVIRDMDASG